MGASTPAPFGIYLDTDGKFFYLILVVLLLGIYVFRNIIRTKVGRAFIAIRDNDIAAEVMGINVFRYKLLAFFIGCFYAGIAGSLWAHYNYLARYDAFTLMDSIWFLGMLIIGGLGSTMGAVFGTVFLKLLQQLTMWMGPSLTFIGGMQAATLANLVMGLAIVLFLIFEPRGLAYRWELFKTRYRLWPFTKA
jgi:branched-chain amino acid transport system permease protein